MSGALPFGVGSFGQYSLVLPGTLVTVSLGGALAPAGANVARRTVLKSLTGGLTSSAGLSKLVFSGSPGYDRQALARNGIKLYFRLGLSAPPAPPQVSHLDGLIFGSAQMNEVRKPDTAPSIWTDQSWNVTRDFGFFTTENVTFGDPLEQEKHVTVGPHGCKWSPTIGQGGAGNHGLYLQASGGQYLDTTDHRALMFWVKKPVNNEGLRLVLHDPGGTVLTTVDFQTITGTVTSAHARSVIDSSKSYITGGLVRLYVTMLTGARAGQTQPIFGNTGNAIIPRFDWSGGGVSVGDTFEVRPFPPSTDTMYAMFLTLRGSDIVGTRTNIGLAAGAHVGAIALYSLGATAPQDIYTSYMQFLQIRDRTVPPWFSGTRPEIRSNNGVLNYAPVYQSRWAGIVGDTYQDNYARYITGNCAGTTEEIFEWAASRWFRGLDPAIASLFPDLQSAWIAAGGSGDLKNFAKAISPQEMGWNQARWQGWEQWGDASGSASGGTIKTLNTVGALQVKLKYWPYWPHSMLSTAFAADAHMSVLRFYVDTDTVHSSMKDKIYSSLIKWSDSPFNTTTLLNYYSTRTLGGLDPSTGTVHTGHINLTDWTSMFDGQEFLYES